MSVRPNNPHHNTPKSLVLSFEDLDPDRPMEYARYCAYRHRPLLNRAKEEAKRIDAGAKKSGLDAGFALMTGVVVIVTPMALGKPRTLSIVQESPERWGAACWTAQQWLQAIEAYAKWASMVKAVDTVPLEQVDTRLRLIGRIGAPPHPDKKQRLEALFGKTWVDSYTEHRLQYEKVHALELEEQRLKREAEELAKAAKAADVEIAIDKAVEHVEEIQTEAPKTMQAAAGGDDGRSTGDGDI